jgi:hypothetical protein
LAFHSEREADHSPPSSAEAKDWVELYLHSPTTPSWRGAQGEHRDNFILIIIIIICRKWAVAKDAERLRYWDDIK